MNEVGYVLWHSLNENGEVNYYDVEWPDGRVETDVPARILEKVRDSKDKNEANPHEAHGIEGYEEKSLVSERKYKKKVDYKKAYKKYHSSKKAKKERAMRNAAGRLLQKLGMKKKGDKKEIDHIVPISQGGTNKLSNLRVIERDKNRKGGQKITTYKRNKKKKRSGKY